MTKFLNRGWLFIDCYTWLKLILIVVVLLFLAKVLFDLVFWRRRSQWVNAFLENCDYQRFVTEIERDISQLKTGQETARNCLLINKCAGLCYLGSLVEAESLLLSIDPNRLPHLFARLYFLNLVHVQLQRGKLDDVRAVVDANPKAFKADTGIAPFDLSIRAAKAALELFFGEAATAKTEFESLLLTPGNPTQHGSVHFYLGLLSLRGHNTDEARQHFAEAITLSRAPLLLGRVRRVCLAHGLSMPEISVPVADPVDPDV